MTTSAWDKLNEEQKRTLIRTWLRRYPPQVFNDPSIRKKAEELGMDWEEEVFLARRDRMVAAAANKTEG